MTLLAGNSNVSAFLNLESFTNSKPWYVPFTAAQSGVASAIKIFGHGYDSGTHFRLCLWDSTGKLLATGAESSNDVEGWNTQTIPSTTIVGGQTYFLGFIGEAYVQLYSSDSWGSKSSGTFTYPIPPALTPGSDPSEMYDFAIYVDGTVGSPAATISSGTPTGTLGTATSAIVGLTTNQTSGTAYWVLDTAANITGISAAQIKAGNNKNGTAAAKAASVAVSNASPSSNITGLTSNTTYSVAAIQNNTNGDSNIITWTFTTAVATRSTSVHLLDGANAGIASTSISWFLTSTWGSSPLESGTTSTNSTGDLLLTGLVSAAGSYLLFMKLASDQNTNAMRPVTLV